MTDYDAQVLLLGPDGYWKLDEASGLSFADSTAGAHPLVAGAGAVENYRIPGPSPAHIPFAVDFLNVNPPACATGTVGQRAIGASFTVECWFGGVGAIAAPLGLIVKGDAAVEQRPWYALSLDTSGRPIWWFRNVAGTDFKLTGYGNLADASYTNRGPYHHIVGTYTPGTADLYVDGIHQVQLAVPNTGWGTGAQGLQLGNFGANIWGGPWLAAVAIYPGQLSAAQVTSNFTLGVEGAPRTFRDLSDQLAAFQVDLSAVLAAVRKTF